MIKRNKIILLLFICAFVTPAIAQKKNKKKKKNPEQTEEKAGTYKNIDDETKGSIEFNGFFTIYQDSTDGSLKMAIKKDQIGQEFIYFSQFSDGVTEAGGFRGSYRGSKIIRIQKYFDKIEFVQINTSSYFDTTNALIKAAEANMPNAIIASIKIEAADKDETVYLIDANSLFLTETFSQVKPPNFPGRSPFAFSLGRLSKEKSKINAIRSYPENTDIAVEYVYSSENILNGGSRAVTDGRNVSMKVYHSFIQMPDNDFTPVIDDPRIGYFTTQVTDMTSPKRANYKDLVHKWHLVKKNPNETLSEPVEPIVWWIENTTPVELRPMIKEAALKWNLAFETAGFKNAVVVKQQSDTATWDAGDIRYNVLRWTASPNPPFGGYGPSFVNPRTGQILGADIMFEYRSVLGRLDTENFFDADPNNLFELMEETTCQHKDCELSKIGALNNAFGNLVLSAPIEGDLSNNQLVQEYICYLILHEIGHTLGLNHNMKSSQLHGLDNIHNKELTEKVGLMGSVMDYPSINASKDRSKQGNYYTTRPGPYDLWAIQFAYENGRTEQEQLALMNRASEPQLTFGNDADDMRSPGRGIDPRVNIFDLSSDAVEYAKERLDLVKELSTTLKEKYSTPNSSYHDLYVGYLSMMRQYYDAASVVSRYIGGVQEERDFVGQPGARTPYTPVSEEDQKNALKVLNDYIFAPKAFDFSTELYNYIQPQRRGFNHWGENGNPLVQNRILSIQYRALAHLLHPTTLTRIVDSKTYGNTYELGEFMTDLTTGIFKADIAGTVSSERQNLQVAYVETLKGMLAGRMSGRYLPTAQSMALYQLKEIQKMVKTPSGDLSTKAHKLHLNTIIANFLKDLK